MSNHRRVMISLFSLVWLYSNAAIPPQQITLEIPKAGPIIDTKKELHTAAKIIPTNLQPGQTQEEIALRVMDHSLGHFTQEDFFRNSEIGRVATKIEKTMTTDLSLGGEEVSHNINMHLQAFEQKAFVKYNGYTNFQITYQAEHSHIKMELTENLGATTQLIVTHDIQDQLSRANLSWTW